jgi:replicative DNA helicase
VPAVSAERIERVPPHDLDAEVSVLGSVLLDNEVVGEIAPLLRPDDFYRDAHRRLYETMLALFDSGKACDAVLLREELRKRGDLDAVGGPSAILEIMERVPTAAHAVHYAEIVRDCAVRRGIISAADKVVRSAFEGVAPARALLDEAESSFFHLARDTERDGAAPIGEVLREVFLNIDRRRDTGAVSGLETGFLDFDDMSGGLQPGEMIVVAGRPSMGKTSFALCLLEHVAVVGGKAAALFSMEMGKSQIVLNMLCSRAKVESSRLRHGRTLAEEEYTRLSAAMGRLGESKIFVDDSPGLTPLAIRSRARRLKKRHDISLLVVDYLQLMSGGLNRRDDNRQQEISFISRSLKALARELEIPVIAISQLNRGVEGRADHRPMMSDLRESGAIEQDADVVLLLHREVYYHQHDEEKRRELEGKAELIIAKQRNGPTGSVPLTFLAPYMRFENGVKENYS